MQNPNYSIVVTGEWPGAGQSTTAKILAQKLGFTRVYAGLLQRKFAHIWNLEKKSRNWQQFQSLFEADPSKLDNYTFNETDFNEKILHQWQLQLQSVNTPEFWDKLVEIQSLLALEKPGIIVEAKVGVLLDKTGLVKSKRLPHKIYKILLTCPPEISAHRVIKRKIENHELPTMNQDNPRYLDLIRETTTETINRHLRDWERYEKIYGIYRSSIYKPGIIKVNTAEREVDEVVNTILNIISQKEGLRPTH
jgi:cytidylate kinase